MVHIQTFGYIPSLLFYLGRYFFSALLTKRLLFLTNPLELIYQECDICREKTGSNS